MSTSTQQIVLVSGASGYLGVEVVLSFLAAGYRVRGTVRTQAQADAFLAKFPEHASNIEFTLVPSITEKGAFDEAVKGVDFIAHTASPVPSGVITDAEAQLLLPAINGTVGILESALREPTGKVQAVVLTSSFAAVRNFLDPTPNQKYDSSSWNPITYDVAKAATGMIAYSGSKVLAERAAWDFMERERPHFTLTTLLPTWILGPSSEPGLTSVADLRSSVGMTAKAVFSTAPPPGLFIKYVHISDIARAHVGAIARPETRGKRYLLVAGPASSVRAAFLLRKYFPEHASCVAPAEDGPIPSPFEADGAPAEAAFGFTYRSFDDTVKDWGEQLFRLKQ